MSTVLVVHDDPFSLRLVGKILAKEGHACLHAADETEAWKWLRANPFVNLIVLDDEAVASKGEAFFRSLRDDLVLQGIPVVVYVGQAERTVIFRYAELGVQALLAKPYKAEALIEEVNRTKKTDWTARVIEPETSVCTRLGITLPDYFSMLSAVAKTIEESLAEFRAVPIKNAEDIRIRKFLRQMVNQGSELGLMGLKLVATALARAIQSVDDAGVRRAISGAESIQGLLRARVNKYMGVHVTPPGLKHEVLSNPEPPSEIGTDRDHHSAHFGILTAGRPMRQFGGNLGKLSTARVISDHDLAVLNSQYGQNGPLNEMVKLARLIFEAPMAGREEVLTLLDAEPGFRDTYLQIALRLGEWGEDAEIEPGVAVDWLGIDRTLVLLAIGRLCKATAVSSPLNLAPLRRHTMLLTLLSYELGTMLRLREHHVPPAAGIAWNVGCWLLALGEPALYGLALAETAHGQRPGREIEAGLFGYASEEIGYNFLASCGAQEHVRELFALRLGKSENKNPALQGANCVLQLAEPLAWAALSGAQALATVVAGLKDERQAVWQQWKVAGLTLPLDISAIGEPVTKEVEAAVSVVETLFAWAEGQGKS